MSQLTPLQRVATWPTSELAYIAGMPRREPQTFSSDGLLAVIEQLGEFESSLKAVRDGMQGQNYETLEIANAVEMKKSLVSIRSFCSAANRAFHERRMENGK